MREPGKIQLRAEAKASAAIDAAMARAERMTAMADARARELIAAHQRKMDELARRSLRGSLRHDARDPRSPPARTGTAFEWTGIDPNHGHRAVAVRAYYKAEQRGFVPGHEIEDWLSAEAELFGVSSAPEPDAR